MLTSAAPLTLVGEYTFADTEPRMPFDSRTPPDDSG